MSDTPIAARDQVETDTGDHLARQLTIRYKIRMALMVSTLLLIFLFMKLNFSAQPVPAIQGVVLSQAKKITAFSLQTHDNKLFTQQSLVGKWHFIAYGYSQCPDICPMTLLSLSTLAHVIKNNESLPPRVKTTQFVFFTVDPQRDTTALLASYINYFHDDFIAVRNNNIAVNDFEQSLGIKALVKTPDDNNDSYSVSHSVSILLTNPEGKLQAVFFPDKTLSAARHFDSEKLYQDFLTIVNYYEKIPRSS